MERTLFERSLRTPEKIVVRHQRTRVLARILEFARVSIHDVVNDPVARAAVRELYHIASECEWETLRGVLAARVERERFIRANR